MAMDDDNIYIFGGIGAKGFIDTELYIISGGKIVLIK
jgi:hypothetical protein